MLRKLVFVVVLLLAAACGSDGSLADELPLDKNRPTFVMFYTQP